MEKIKRCLRQILYEDIFIKELVCVLFYPQICKHFLEAVEKSKYGWFWQCPTGESCIYRHALPAGFVLKKDKKKDDKKNDISLEDLIEKERAALGDKQTRVTLETFLAWKKRKIQVNRFFSHLYLVYFISYIIL